MADGNNFSTLALILATGLSGLAGALVGVLGGWFIQSRSQNRSSLAALDSVLVEMTINTTCLEMAANKDQLTLDSIKTLMWDRYCPELVHCLRREYLRIAQTQQISVDQMNQAYRAIQAGITARVEVAMAVKATLLSWSFATGLLVKRIRFDQQLRPWHRQWWGRLLDGRGLEEKIESLTDEIDHYVANKLTELGYELDDDGELQSGRVRADLKEFATGKGTGQ